MAATNWSSICDDVLGGLQLAQLPSTLSLPALPLAVTLFLQKADDPETSIGELGKIVSTDTGLTAELLRFANSSAVGSRNDIKTVQQALALLGLKTVRGFLVITGTRAAVQARQSRLINQQCFWNASIQKALFAKLIARILKADEETAFAGSLLQDFLLPVITNELFDQYVLFLQHRDEHPVLMADFEQRSFGWNHAVAGACLARRWKLPDELVACILFHHHGLHVLADSRLARTPVAAVAISALIPDQLRQCYVGLEQLELLQQKWPAFQIGPLVKQVDELHAGLGIGVTNDFPLVRRCKPAMEPDRSSRFNDGSLTVAAACKVALAASA